MSKLGIVGSEGAKFTPKSEQTAREIIAALIKGAELVVSGACHLGGIDKWAIEEATKQGIPTQEFPPKTLKWEGGYKQRNLQIVDAADTVICVTVKQLPEGYKGMRFSKCYHCNTDEHVKSGGCWTMKQAMRQGKQGILVVVE